MALTDSLPTGDAGGLTVVDERLILAGLIAKNADGSARTGVFPVGATPLVTGRATMGYDVAPFKGVASRTGAGVELVANDATTTVITTPAPGANSRIDVIWFRTQFTANTDPSNVPIFGVTQGAAAGVPTKPPIPAGAVELATAQVPSTATNTASVVITQTAQWTAMAGGIVPVRSATELAAFTAADDTLALNRQTGAIMRRAGGAWVAAGEDTGWVTLTSFSVGFTTTSGYPVRIRRIGSTVRLKGSVTRLAGSGTLGDIFTVPTGFRPAVREWVGVSVASSGYYAPLNLQTNGVLGVPAGYGAGAFAAGDALPLMCSWTID